MKDLSQMCLEKLDNFLNVGNAFEILNSSPIMKEKFDISSLESACWKVIEEETEKCLEQKAFLDTSYHNLLTLLKLEHLNCEEELLFEFSMKWFQFFFFFLFIYFFIFIFYFFSNFHFFLFIYFYFFFFLK